MRLVPAAQLSPDQLASVRALYLEAFPPHERSDFAQVLTERVLVLLDGGDGASDSDTDRDERPAGLAVLRDLGDTGWAFLRYFAVADRGRGVGGRFWRLLREAHARYERIVLDVDDPDEAGIEEAERSIRIRRIDFYRRLGVELTPVRGYAPPHDGVEVPMRLMVADLRIDPGAGAGTGQAAQPGETTSCTGADLRDVVVAVLDHRYGLDPGSPAVRRTLEAAGLSDLTGRAPYSTP